METFKSKPKFSYQIKNVCMWYVLLFAIHTNTYKEYSH